MLPTTNTRYDLSELITYIAHFQPNNDRISDDGDYAESGPSESDNDIPPSEDDCDEDFDRDYRPQKVFIVHNFPEYIIHFRSDLV